ncbi:MAG: tail fiber domain-containing protein [Bacteroidota bacterium]
MKRQFQVAVLSLLCFLFVVGAANAQLISTNNLGNFPPTGPFNINGKFTSLGESGGIPGPVNGCDFYGFRAQTDSINAVNLGMQFLSPGTNIPTLSFGGLPLLIAQQDATGPGTGAVLGCGKLLALYFDGLGGPAPNLVYQVFGSAVATGGNWVPSDLSLKQDVRSISSAMEIVNQLNGVTYEYKTEERPELNLTPGLQYGFIADEVKEIMPEAVQRGMTPTGEAADYDVMNYDMIIPVLAEALKEQQATIKKLEERIVRLEGQSKASNSSINASSDKVGLNQNRPNPFTGVTTIAYDIPADLNTAKMVIYDSKGAVVDIFSIAGGQGEIEFDASNLNGGVYFYSIEADGANLARKKMIVK